MNDLVLCAAGSCASSLRGDIYLVGCAMTYGEWFWSVI